MLHNMKMVNMTLWLLAMENEKFLVGFVVPTG